MKVCEQCGYENEDFQDVCVSCGAPLPQKKGKGMIIGLVCAIAAVIVVAVVGVLLFYNSDGQVYVRAMDKGNNYYSLGDYDTALDYYEIALEALPEKEEVYLKMANAYEALGDTEAAQNILAQGYDVTSSARIEIAISSLAEEADAEASKTTLASDDSVTVEEAQTLAASVTMNTSIYKIISNYTYGDYRRDYGIASVTTNSDGQVVVGLTGGSMTLYYYNTDENPNAVSNDEPMLGAKPTEIEINTLEILFAGFEGGLTQERLEELLGKTLEITYDDETETYVTSFVYEDCNVTVETDSEGYILSASNDAYASPTSYEEEEEEEEEGAVEMSGYVTDASTGTGVYGATMKFMQNGEEIESLTTAGDGYYELKLDVGDYEVEVSLSGYISETFTFTIGQYDTYCYQNMTISPEMEEGVIRIVLEWGATPRDLDSHTEGTFSNGTSFSVAYTNKQTGTSGTNYYATLDVDDTSGNGVETTTIYDVGADFEFYVYNYSGEAVSDWSNVTVKVYMGDGLVETFTGPDATDLNGTTDTVRILKWNVFSYSNGTITKDDLFLHDLVENDY